MHSIHSTKVIGGGVAAALMVGTLALGGVSPAHAQIKGVTNCAAPGGKQEGGAVIGAVLGGLLGNSVSGHNRTTGTVVGAAAGAAAGSAVGCKMQRNDQRAQYGAATYTRNGYRLSSNIAPARFERMNDGLVATRTVNIRSAPTTGSARVGQLQAGQRFQAMAAVRGTEWILVGDHGVGVGYVHGAYVAQDNPRYARR